MLRNAISDDDIFMLFTDIMRYMGDYPMTKGMGHITCVLFVLMQCHSKHILVDEVFCQLIKQTTNNRSTKRSGMEKADKYYYHI